MNTSHPFSNASWDDVRLFAAALEHGSFTEASRALGVGQATMSRRIAELERVVGLSLFDRTRGGLEPTAAALRLRPWAESMGASMRDAAAALADLEAAPEGTVRVTCAPGVAADVGPVVVKRLALKYPRLLIELLADTRVRDLAAHEADIAVRNAAPDAGPLLVKKVAEFSVGLYCSKALRRRLPKRPRLEQVPLLDWSAEQPHLVGQLAALPCPRVLRSTDFLVMCAAAEAGIGAIAITDMQASLRGLVPVGAELPLFPRAPMYLVTHQALRRVPRVAAVVAELEAFASELVAGRVSRSPSGQRKATSPSPR